MQYFVIAPDGQKYGPADVPTLNSWITEGRLLPDTQLQDTATGAVMAAAMVPGLQFPMAPGPAPQAPMAPQSPDPMAGATPGFDVPGPSQPQQPYQAPQQPQQPYQAPQQPQQPYQAPQQPYQAPQQPYQQPGPYQQPPGSNYPRPMSADDGSGDVQKAYIFGAISFICCPIIFGVLGIIFAIQGKNKGNPRAQGALILSICGLVAGIFISIGLNILLGGFSRF